MHTQNNHKDPLVSICIPTYRRPEYLRRALESIVSQPSFGQDFEVLVADDHSPEDETGKVMRLYASAHANIRCWRHDANKGEGANEVFLMRQAKGTYVFFLTDDDSFLPGSLQELKSVLSGHLDCTFIASSMELRSERDGAVSTFHSFPESCVIPREDVDNIAKLLFDFHISSRMCWRRDAVDLGGHERHIPSLYQHLYTIGYTALQGKTYYHAKPFVSHTTQNEMFWTYADDYMISGYEKIIRELSSINPGFREPAYGLLAEKIGANAVHSLSRSRRGFLKYIRGILQIHGVRLSPRVWLNIGISLGMFVARQCVKKTKKLIKALPGYADIRRFAKSFLGRFRKKEELFVSDTYQCILIRMPKTASTSILSVFPDMRGSYSPPTSVIKQHAGKKWDRYYKFIFARNTWDRVLSIYLYLDKRIRETQQGIPFKRWPKEWIDTGGDLNKFLKHFNDKYGPAWIENMHEIFHSQMRWIRDPRNGKPYPIDFVGRYEHLQEDFDKICKDIGREPTRLPLTNTTQHGHYRDHYNEESRKIIEEAYGEEIRYFGFKF